MAKFRITAEGGETFEVDADNEADALEMLGAYQKNNYTGPTEQATVNGVTTEVPEGMVFDPNTGAMVDAKAMADRVDMGKAGLMSTAARGLPFIGSWMDELYGTVTGSDEPYKSREVNEEYARQTFKKTDEAYPKTSVGLKVAGAVAPALAAAPFLPSIAPSSLGGRVLAGTVIGAPTGALEGAITGAGENEKGRWKGAEQGAKIGAGLGGIFGATAPLVAAGVKKGANAVLDYFTVNGNLAKLGLDRTAADVASTALKADDAMGPTGLQKMAKVGPDAMLADAGESSTRLLDATITKAGPGANEAAKAVEERSARANKLFTGVLDRVLGQPEGVNAAAKANAMRTQAARDAAYKAAYNTPIDYAAAAGRQIEDVFSRTPPKILSQAIERANDSMRIAGSKNKQIMASIAPNGEITFREMPNMQQVDALKKAMDEIAFNTGKVDPSLKSDIRRLTRELREAALDATGGKNGTYAKALKLGGDNIAEREALELGTKMLSPSMTREAVKEGVDGLHPTAKTQLEKGLRQAIDDKMANAYAVASDANIDAREAAQAIKDLSSRAVKEKLYLALGDQKAGVIIREIERMQKTLELRARVARNSATAGRQAIYDDVSSRMNGGTLEALKEGRPLETPRRLWQGMTGATPDAKAAAEQEVYSQIARLLTGPRGQDAQNALQSLLDAYRTGQANQSTARTVGNIAGAALLGPLSLVPRPGQVQR